jgi:hypothetical protein
MSESHDAYNTLTLKSYLFFFFWLLQEDNQILRERETEEKKNSIRKMIEITFSLSLFTNWNCMLSFVADIV